MRVAQGYPLPDADQPVAIRNTLQQLSRLPAAAGTTLQLTDWRWTAELAAVMAALLPGLPQFRVSVHAWALTDALVQAAASIGPCVHELSSDWDMNLSEGVMLNGPGVPWAGLRVREVSLATLPQHIDPHGAPLLITTFEFSPNYPSDADEVGHTSFGACILPSLHSLVITAWSCAAEDCRNVLVTR